MYENKMMGIEKSVIIFARLMPAVVKLELMPLNLTEKGNQNLRPELKIRGKRRQVPRGKLCQIESLVAKPTALLSTTFIAFLLWDPERAEGWTAHLS